MMTENTTSYKECWYKDVCSKANTETCSNNCIRLNVVNFLMQSSNIPKHRQSNIKLKPCACDIESFETLSAIKNNISEFVKDGKNLMIYSKTSGNGKTSWAFKLMCEYFNKIWFTSGYNVKGIYYYLPEFFKKQRDLINSKDEDLQEQMDNLYTCDLVIFDDVGASAFTDYRTELLCSIIEARLNANKSCIFTSNVTAEEISKVADARLVRRIWNECLVVKFNGDTKGSN